MSREDMAIRPILIVDDDPEAIFILRKSVEKFRKGHPILTFSDGLEVVEFLTTAYPFERDNDESVPCLLLVDLKMPLLTGFDVLAWLQQIYHFAPMLRVVVSSSDDPNDMARAKSLGASEYLFKFPRPETLNALIQAGSEAHSRQV